MNDDEIIEFGFGFGLAQVKREGAFYIGGKEVTEAEYNSLKTTDNTRWIEMCYDPSENMKHIDMKPFREAFQTQITCNDYTDDDVYLIIKSLANEFIKEGGW